MNSVVVMRKRINLILFFFILLSLTSCASVEYFLKHDKSLRRDKIINIRGRAYLPLDFVCSAGEWDYHYDFLTHKLTLKRGSREISFIIGENFFLKDGEIYFFDHLSCFYKGGIFISLLFYEQELRKTTLLPQIYTLKTVVLDPGHGGKDPGAIGRRGVQEKEVNLSIALYLKRILEANGLKVVLTRDKDEFVSLKKRAEIANRNKDAIFVSIHANSTYKKKGTANGFEVYYLSEKMDDYTRAVAKRENAVFQDAPPPLSSHANITLWDIIYTENRAESIELAKAVLHGLEKITDLNNRGVKKANFFVLRSVDLPGVLIEVGFLSHPQEERKLASRRYQYLLARGIAKGIMEFKREYERTNGWTR